ncbi:MAG: hypothetical protein IBJ11_05480 [Phycisphaerales bacterium]|nr:hypothetical protein [Phycisphaerales bacterium]
MALPRDASGDRWRASLAPIIGLQAVTFALSEAPQLSDDERLLGLDRAETQIRGLAADLGRAWRGEEMPAALLEILADARRAAEAAAALGYEWVVAVDRFVMPPIRPLVAGSGGDVLAAEAGTILFRGEPAVFIRPKAPALAVAGLERSPTCVPPRQVYRIGHSDTGRVSHDLVAPMLAAMPPGRPLLGTVMEGGAIMGQDDPVRAQGWMEAQRRALGDGAPEVRLWSPEAG